MLCSAEMRGKQAPGMTSFRRQGLYLANLVNNELQSEIILKEDAKFTMELTCLIQKAH